MNQPIKIAVIGLGRAGMTNHINVFRLLREEYEIAGVYDADPERARQVAGEIGATAYRSVEAALADGRVEVVVIATPSNLHCEQSCQALAAGKDVVCEKPMSPGYEEALAMAACAEKNGRVLAVFHNARFAPDFEQVKAVVDSECLGRIVEVKICWNGYSQRTDWQTLRRFGGGSLRNTGPHPIDHALQLIPKEGELEVFASMDCVLATGDAEDHLHLWIRSRAGGPLVDLEVSSSDAWGANRWQILGSHGGLRGSAQHLAWKFRPEGSWKASPAGIAWEEGAWTLPEGLRSLSHRYWSRFFADYRGERKACVDLADALRVMEVIDLATLSHAGVGAPVAVSF